MEQPYQLTSTGSILRRADNAHIPVDSGNADYQTYQAWVAEGNTSDPAPPPSASYQNALIKAQMSDVEVKQNRAVREINLGNGSIPYDLPGGGTSTPIDDLRDIEAQMAALRGQLVKED